MGIKIKNESQNGHHPIHIRDVIFECKCGELLNLSEVEKHRQEKHPNEYHGIVSLCFCGDDADGERWSQNLGICGCGCVSTLLLEPVD